MTNTVLTGFVFGVNTMSSTFRDAQGPSFELAGGAEQPTWSGATVFRPAQPSRRGARVRNAALEAYRKTPEGQESARQAKRSLANALERAKLAPMAALRLRAGLSQQELSERSGLKQPHISRLENGQPGSMSNDTLKRLADALGVSMDDVNLAFQATQVRNG